MVETRNEFSTSDGQTRSSLIEWMARDRKRIAYILYAVGGIFLALAIGTYVRYRTDWAPLALWFASLAMIAVLAGIWQHFREPALTSEHDLARLLILALGGAAGLVTTLILGVGLAVKWWPTLTGGWQAWQGENNWQVWVIIASVFGGLALMFVSLQAVAGSVRENPLLRRLVYGYNAVLTSLLLLAILTLLNVLAYTPWGPFKYLSQTYPWTESSIYGLSPKSENILKGLNKPVKIFALVPARAPNYRPVKALLDNIGATTDKVQIEYLDPDRDLDRAMQLANEYKFGERVGILIVSGTPPNTDMRFVNYQDLEEPPDMMTRNRAPAFRGESAIINEINVLAEGKEKPVLYFTQGNGEMDLSNARRSRNAYDRGLGELKRALEADNFVVKGLRFSAVAGAPSENPDIVTSAGVPNDASMVIVAGPREPFQEDALKAIREYVNPTDPAKGKGKLVALLEPALSADGAGLVTTGLEKLLGEFGVEVGQNRLIKLRQYAVAPSLTDVFAIVNPDERFVKDNPIAGAFKDKRFGFVNGTRTIDPSTAEKSPNNKHQAESLLLAPPTQDLFAASDVRTPALDLVRDLDAKKELEKQLATKPLSIAVVVTESSPGAGGGPHAFMQSEQHPRLIVFGNSAFAGNFFMNPGVGVYYDLFRSCLDWLRERPASVGIQARKSNVFQFEPTEKVDAMVWIPGILMFVGIVGLGTGVWVVRRR